MKKIIAILAAFVATTALFAQQTENEIYAKYNGKKGVSTVYISPAMFKMMSKLPELEVADDKDVDISTALKSFNGMYVIEIEDSRLHKQLVSDVNLMIQNSKMELMTETNDGEESVKIYVEYNGDCIKNFVLLECEHDSATFISIIGEIDMKTLQQLMN